MCESANFTPFVNVYGFDYVECQNCGNLFLQNPLKNIVALYTNEGSNSHYTSSYYSDELFKTRLKNIALPKAKFVSKVIKQEKNKLWLDMGSGAGDLLLSAKKLGFDIMGFESDLQAVNFSNEKLKGEVVKEGFLDIKNPQKTMKEAIARADVISFLNVLEHLEFPKDTFEFFSKTMKKDSFLVIEVPRHPSLASFSNLLSPQRVYRHLIAPFHLNIFSEKSLKLVYESFGFTLVAKWCYGQGFMDIIHSFKNFNEDANLYEKISLLSNDIQKIIDKNDLSDFLLIVLQRA